MGRRSCSTCDRSFSRPEHLRRHLLTHSQTAVAAHVCQLCDKRFTRRDALLRHEAAHAAHAAHQSGGRTQDGVWKETARTRACSACARARVRCSGGTPCERCVTKSIDACEHPLRKRRVTTTSVPSDEHQHEHQHEPRIEHVAASPLLHVEMPPDMHVPGTDYDADNLHQANSWIDLAIVRDGVNNTNSNAVADHGLYSLGRASGTEQSLNWLPFDIDVMDEPHAFGSMDFPILPSSAETAASHRLFVDEPNVLLAYQNHNQPEALPVIMPLRDSSESNPCPQPAGVGPPPSYSGAVLSSASISSEDNNSRGDHVSAPNTYTGYAAGHGARSTRYDAGSMPRKRRRGLRSGSLSLPRRIVSSFPSTSPNGSAVHDHEHDIMSHLEDTSDAKNYVSEQLYAVASQHYRDAVCGGGSASALMEPVAQQPFPSRPVLNHFISLYLDHVHVLYPILDSLRLARHEVSWPLLIALAAVGASNASPKPARSSAELLLLFIYHHMVAIYQEFQVEEDLDSVLTLALTIMGLCQSSSKALVCRGHRARDILAGACHRTRLFESTSLPRFVSTELPSEVSWNSWRQREGQVRTGLFVWMLDCILAYTTDFHPRFQLDDLKLHLPCEEAMWQTDDLEHWTKLHAKHQEAQTVHDALVQLHVQGCIRPSVSDFGRELLIHALFQWNWQVQRYYTNKLSQWTPVAPGAPGASGMTETPGITPTKAESSVPYPASIPQISQRRNSACDCLDVLHWEALSVSSKAGGLEGPLFLTLHLARLVLLSPISQLRGLAEKDGGSGGASSSSSSSSSSPWPSLHPANTSSASVSLSECKSTVWCWFTRDKYKCRLAVLHAGGIYWHARRYASDSMLQPYAVFTATLVLWAYATCSSTLAAVGAGGAGGASGISGAGGAGGATGGIVGTGVSGVGGARGPAAAAPPASNLALTPQEIATTTAGTDGNIENPPTAQPSTSSMQVDDAATCAVDDVSSDSGSEARPPAFMHIDRPFDDELAQHFIRAAEHTRAFVEGVGDLSNTTQTLVLEEGIRILRKRCRTWAISETYMAILKGMAPTFAPSL